MSLALCPYSGREIPNSQLQIFYKLSGNHFPIIEDPSHLQPVVLALLDDGARQKQLNDLTLIQGRLCRFRMDIGPIDDAIRCEFVHIASRASNNGKETSIRKFVYRLFFDSFAEIEIDGRAIFGNIRTQCHAKTHSHGFGMAGPIFLWAE